MNTGDEFNKTPGALTRQANCDAARSLGITPPPQNMKPDNMDFPMVLVPSMIPQTVFLPNFQPMYVPTPNPEFIRMMQMYAANQQYERQVAKVTTEKVLVEEDFDTSDIPLIPGRSIMQEQLMELTKLALKGCDLGERVALTHQKRPCFKKIDSLCARMKQDLMRPDGVLANVNSQGIAWAVKDFIFAFTRIINAWVIIKGYTNSSTASESLSKVKNSLSPNFMDSFQKWQESTHEFVEEIIKSFISLDQLVQTQRGATNNKKKSPTRSDSNSTENLSDTIDESFSFNTTAESDDGRNTGEEPAKDDNATYFKTGVYEPLKTRKDSKPDILENAPETENPENHTEKRRRFTEVDPQMMKKLSDSLMISRQMAHIVDALTNLTEGEYFFSSIFIENYFPGFCKVNPTFIDVRTIILKTQMGRYDSIYEIVLDLQQIILDAHKYLKIRPTELLRLKTLAFKAELETILSHEIFSSLDFTQLSQVANA